jgi:hypothetical protein
MAAAGTEGIVRIRDDYFIPAVDKSVAGTAQRRAAHLTLASFLADLYQRRSERLR